MNRSKHLIITILLKQVQGIFFSSMISKNVTIAKLQEYFFDEVELKKYELM